MKMYRDFLTDNALAALDALASEHNTTGTTPDDDMDVLAALVMASRATRILQFGTFLGGSAVVLADLAATNAASIPGAAPAKFVTVDPDNNYNTVASKYIDMAGHKEITQYALSFSTDPGLIAELRKHTWDLVFLDTTHQYFDTVDEIRAIVPVCDEHTLFCFHDASIHAALELDTRKQGGVQRAIREFVVANPAWQSFIFQSPPFGKYGIGVMQLRPIFG